MTYVLPITKKIISAETLVFLVAVCYYVNVKSRFEARQDRVSNAPKSK